ncbi:MAG: septum formation initiator family protein [Lachnospiraceae bacterium]|jgi:cell division protein FtsB|nr:septum formation initiator family protein [Lachnospiraceae bacterium]
MRFSLFLTGLVVVLLIAVVCVRSYGFARQLAEKEAYIEQLETQLDAEHARTEEIEEYKKYTQTRGYIERVAKEKLGLVYEGEIVFRHE